MNKKPTKKTQSIESNFCIEKETSKNSILMSYLRQNLHDTIEHNMMTKWYRRNRAGLQRKGTQEAAARMDAIRARVASAWDHTRSEYWISERKKKC